MYSASTSPRLLWTTQSYWLSYRLGLHVTSTCVYKIQSWHQVPESGDTFLQSAFPGPFTIVWGKPQSSNLSISCFKISDTIKSTCQYPRDGKIHFYWCFLPVHVFAVVLQQWPLTSDAGPIRVYPGVTWLAKWRGKLGPPWILPAYTKRLLSQWCKIQRLICTFHWLLSEQNYIPCDSVDHTIVPTSAIWWATFHPYKPWWF